MTVWFTAPPYVENFHDSRKEIISGYQPWRLRKDYNNEGARKLNRERVFVLGLNAFCVIEGDARTHNDMETFLPGKK